MQRHVVLPNRGEWGVPTVTGKFIPMLRLSSLVLAGLMCAALPAAARTAAPLGFQLMCLRAPEACLPGGAEQVDVTPDLLKTLRQVNLRINLAIRPKSDGRTDRWTLGASRGDCEEYVLAKRHELISRGLPSSALRIAQVKTRKGEGHAILVVHTDAGDFVLDNLSQRLSELRATGYRLVAMSTADPRVWR